MLHGAGKISITEMELVYESAFLNAISRFEGLLNELLEEFVCGRYQSPAGHVAHVSVTSRAVYRNLARGKRDYADMLPYSTCLELAERFLRNGGPFAAIDENDRRLLGQAFLIRNAIAHRSDFAITKFRDKVVGVSSLPAHRRFPGALLRRDYRAHPVQSWNTLYLGTLQKVGANLANNW